MRFFAALSLLLIALAPVSAAPPPAFSVTVTGHGPNVILIPGLSSSGAVWDGTVAQLKDHYQCHVLTLAGLAGTPRVKSPFLQTVHDQIVAYIRTQHLDRPIIIGHSLGGFMAL